MAVKIEQLCSARDFASITRSFPHAVRTPAAIVIPRFLSVSQYTSIDAEILPDHTVVLRPRIEHAGPWSSEIDLALDRLRELFGFAPQTSPRETSYGRVVLEREWSEFRVLVRPIAEH